MLLAGTGPLNLQVACELVARGVKPVAVLDSAPAPWSGSWGAAARMVTAAPGLVAEGMRDVVDAPARRRSGFVVDQPCCA